MKFFNSLILIVVLSFILVTSTKQIDDHPKFYLFDEHESSILDNETEDKSNSIENTDIDTSNEVTPRLEKGRWHKIRKIIANIQKGLKKFWNSMTKGLDAQAKSRQSMSSKMGEKIEEFFKQFRAIYPGTKWCGAGNISKSYDELGIFYVTDACCREHDSCEDTLNPGEVRYGLENNGLFTRSHCSCDNKFYECLRKSCTHVSRAIGRTYFNLLGPQCFGEEHPIKNCKKWYTTESNLTKCDEYVTDRKLEPVIQWIDNKWFSCP